MRDYCSNIAPTFRSCLLVSRGDVRVTAEDVRKALDDQDEPMLKRAGEREGR